jgi:hypothetical protein
MYGVLIQACSFWLLNFFYSFGYTHLMAIPVVTYILSFAMGLGGTLYLYCSEVVPPTGVGIAMFGQWVFTSLIAKFMPRISAVVPTFWMFNIFMVLCLVIFFVIDIIGVETKGKTSEQITKDFNKKRLLPCSD